MDPLFFVHSLFQIIILDEPTSGLDPFNRMTLWQLLRDYKKGRTIILTTHYMEEADALSDRIAVMNHGQVKCCGSPIFLKDRFGSGYKLTITKDANFNKKALKRVVEEVTVKKANFTSDVAREVTVAISAESNSKLPELLSRIEENMDKLGIINYGISSPTVEDVFLK